MAAIDGDINSDGVVDLTDFGLLADVWLNPPSTPSADIAPIGNIDGMVDFLDLEVLSAHWLLTAPDANEMVFLLGGEFEMGNHFLELDPNESDELPVHWVNVDPFYMGKYEVTNGQYSAFLNAALAENAIYLSGNTVYGITGSDPNQAYCQLAESGDNLIEFSDGAFTVLTKGGRDMSDDPVVCVSWYGAAAYCNWRSEQAGYQTCYDLSNWTCDFTQKGYRLPTEAEWEYAARGGKCTPYTRFGWGDIIDHDRANYSGYWESFKDHPFYDYDNADDGFHPNWDDGVIPYTAMVGSFPANDFGLHDMNGNVYEWCQDRYDFDVDYYRISPRDNPTGPASGNGRVLRGGSWYMLADACRTASRYPYLPERQRDDAGFRLCLDLE